MLFRSISNGDTNVYYVLANTSTPNAFLALPTGQPAGRLVTVVESVVNGTSTHEVTVKPSGTDKLYDLTNTLQASVTGTSTVTVVCDGSGNWYVLLALTI